jgi:transcription initiation factor TFIIH subunit 4
MSIQLQDYLQLQTGITFKKLYQQPATVLAVLRRMLPHLAKNVVMAMLFMHEPFSERDLIMWFKDEAAGFV